MPDDTMDLWPDELATAERQPPVAILRTQAALLGRKTRNLVIGRVTTPSVGQTLFSHLAPTPFVYVFQLVAPALNDYTYDLFSISHGVDLYPVHLDFHAAGGTTTESASEQEFIQVLDVAAQGVKSGPSRMKRVSEGIEIRLPDGKHLLLAEQGARLR